MRHVIFLLVLPLLLSAHAGQAQSCLGDCSSDREVTVDEIILGVNIALGTASLNSCPSFDRNQNQEVEIDELITAVNYALTGCPPAPTHTATAPPATATVAPPSATATALPPSVTPTQLPPSATATVIFTHSATRTATESSSPTATAIHTASASATAEASPSPSGTPTPEATATQTEQSTPTMTPSETPTAEPSISATATETPAVTATVTETAVATATATGGAPAEAVAGRASLVSNAMNAFNGVVSSLLVSIKNGNSGALQRSAARAADINACPISGTTSEDCIRSNNLAHLTLNASLCSAEGPAGGVATFDGTVTLDGPGVCPVPFGGTYNADLTVQIVPQAAPALNITANINGDLTPTVDFGNACLIEGLDGTINGTLSATLADGSGSTITFNNTHFTFTDPQYSEDCVPLRYTFTFDGAATVSEPHSGASFSVIFQNFAVTHNAETNPLTVTLEGGLQTNCVASLLLINTITPLAVSGGELCPRAGQLQVDTGSLAQIFYRSDGSVDIDADNNGSIDASYGSCLAPELLTCQGG